MSEFLTNYIAVYGYFAIFCIILLQELGMPGLPNELVLFYFGYLSRKAGLSYPVVIGVAVLADISGSYLLYLLFYHAKNVFTRLKPNWLRLPERKISLLKEKIESGKALPIFVAKLTPFVRSYLPVVAGLLQVEPVFYARIILFTAIIWSGGWITAGWLLHF